MGCKTMRGERAKSATLSDNNHLVTKLRQIAASHILSSTLATYFSSLNTMSFPSAIAGPSRLPFQAVAASSRCLSRSTIRSYSAATAEPPTTAPSETPSPAPPADQGLIYFGTAGKGKGRVRPLPYYLWKRTIGASLETPTHGQKAKWLGGEVVRPALFTSVMYSCSAVPHESLFPPTSTSWK